MCGIVGYVGKKKACGILIEGLKRLEYRGYDSAGVAIQNGRGLVIRKLTGRVQGLSDSLAEEGISVEVIDPRTLMPFDIDTIVKSVQKTGRLVVAHEACVTGGVGGEIGSQVAYRAFDYLAAPIERVGAKDTPIPFAPILEREVLPDDQDVVEAAYRAMDYSA